MSKVRVNDLARELEVKSKEILDALAAVGVTEKKTHSSSIEGDEAVRVRSLLTGGRGGARGNGAPAVENRPKVDFKNATKPGDIARAILERKQAEQAAASAPRSVPPRPVVSPPVVTQPERPAAAAPAAAASAAPSSAPAPAPPMTRQERLDE